MIMSLKQRKIKFEPSIKLNHNIYFIYFVFTQTDLYFTRVWFLSDDKEFQSSFDEQEKQQESSSTHQGKCLKLFLIQRTFC